LKKVKTFTEKPELTLAQKFFDSGDFLWNAGIFVWSVNAIITAFEKHQPELAELFLDCQSAYFTDKEQKQITKAYSQSKNISIDYAIMEKSDHVFVILGDFGWSDLGSWNALHEIKDKDKNNNVLEADTLLYNADDNYIISKSKNKRLVVAHELSGYLIADFDDVLLICKKEDSGVFRDFVNDVKLDKSEELI